MLKRVRLELARSRGFPEGSTRHGYELVLPLDENGRFDATRWEMAPEIYTVHRFWKGEGDSVGELVRPKSGTWAFSYEPGRGDDEVILRLEEHVFRVGEYLSIQTAADETRTLRVVLVETAPGHPAEPRQKSSSREPRP
jgi:hypothetical protein